jgi:PAS domain S-box-containing protein
MPSSAPQRDPDTPGQSTPLHIEIEERFGMLPNFFRLVPEAPEVMTNLWGFAKFGYLDSPLPSLFKERLFVYLSRFCEVRYCIARHAGFLVGLGRPAGDSLCRPETIEEVVRLICRPLPRGDELKPHLEILTSAATPLAEMPSSGTQTEEALFACAAHVFLQTQQASLCLDTLAEALDKTAIEQVLVFLTFIRAAHFWTKVHPELEFEDDIKTLFEAQQPLAECILNDSEASVTETTQVLREELEHFRQEQRFWLEVAQANQTFKVMEERLAAIVASSDDIIVSKTLDGIITSWNRGAEQILGYTADEVIGKHVSILMPPDNKEDTEKILRSIRQGQKVDHYQTKRQTKNGDIIDVSLTVSPIRDESGRIVGASKVGRDITAQKRIEAERQRAEQRKDEFLAMLSHELRNPIGAISNCIQLVQAAQQPELLPQFCDVIWRQVSQLTHLVEDLLDASRIGQGKIALRRTTVDLSAVMGRAAEQVQPLIAEKRHRLTISFPDHPVRFVADPTRIEQILVNLLTNAAKYSEPGGSIRFSAVSEGDEIVFRIRDTGIGIPAEMLPEVFGLFTQIDATADRSQGGLGIGLTLVRRLVEMHGGTVTAASEGKGKGSEFTIRLPVGQPTTETIDPTIVPTPAKAISGRILVVDDSHDTARLTARMLAHTGYEVAIAYDGPAAIEVARSFQPDAIVLDIGLPGMDGFEVASTLRKDECCQNAVLIAVSGYGEEKSRERAKAAGFNHHLTKPVDLKELIGLITA